MERLGRLFFFLGRVYLPGVTARQVRACTQHGRRAGVPPRSKTILATSACTTLRFFTWLSPLTPCPLIHRQVVCGSPFSSVCCLQCLPLTVVFHQEREKKAAQPKTTAGETHRRHLGAVAVLPLARQQQWIRGGLAWMQRATDTRPAAVIARRAGSCLPPLCLASPPAHQQRISARLRLRGGSLGRTRLWATPQHAHVLS